MRFDKPVPVSKIIKSFKKQKREIVDDGESVDMDDIPEYDDSEDNDGEYSDGEGYYPKNIFSLGAKDKPTARRPTWRYRWRGMEAGEGEIQLDIDREVQSIAFGDEGNSCRASSIANFIGESPFTGIKVRSRLRNGNVDPDSVE